MAHLTVIGSSKRQLWVMWLQILGDDGIPTLACVDSLLGMTTGSGGGGGGGGGGNINDSAVFTRHGDSACCYHYGQ